MSAYSPREVMTPHEKVALVFGRWPDMAGPLRSMFADVIVPPYGYNMPLTQHARRLLIMRTSSIPPGKPGMAEHIRQRYGTQASKEPVDPQTQLVLDALGELRVEMLAMEDRLATRMDGIGTVILAMNQTVGEIDNRLKTG